VTVDELMKIGRAARTAYIMQRQGVAGTLPDAERAATVAIVQALRNEIADAYERGFDDATSEDWGSPRKHRSNYACAESIINEILGDAGEKVAETPDPPTRTVQLTGITKSKRPDIQFEPATDPIRDAVAMARGRVLVVDDIPMLNKLAAAMKPATDAAPAVCVWTKHAEKRWSIQCAPHGFFNPTPKRLAAERCAMCKAPIKFTEANHG